jgi:hypothetical protein
MGSLAVVACKPLPTQRENWAECRLDALKTYAADQSANRTGLLDQYDEICMEARGSSRIRVGQRCSAEDSSLGPGDASGCYTDKPALVGGRPPLQQEAVPPTNDLPANWPSSVDPRSPGGQAALELLKRGYSFGPDGRLRDRAGDVVQ